MVRPVMMTTAQMKIEAQPVNFTCAGWIGDPCPR